MGDWPSIFSWLIGVTLVKFLGELSGCSLVPRCAERMGVPI
jgi:hypothetical protein